MTRALRRCLGWTALGVLPALVLALCFAAVLGGGAHDSDFWTFWKAGRDVLHGDSPYPSLASLPAHAGPTFAPFVYPPVAAVLIVPFAVLPYAAAKTVFFLVSVAAVALALRLLGVRDWRCYGAVLGSAPVYSALGLGTIGPFLLLAAAAAWRYREHAVAAGLLVAAAITAKLFLWPLWLWLVRTRRYRAAAVAAVAGVAAVLGSWSLIGFAGLREYPRLLARLTGLVGPQSYSLYALVRSFGAGGATAERLTDVVALVALAVVARRVRRDASVLAAAVAVSLLATPILWTHYLVLLFVPVALLRRTFSWAWAIPLAFWFDAAARSGGNSVRIAAVLALAAVIVALTVRRRAVAAPYAPGARFAVG